MLCYVDDILLILHDPRATLQALVTSVFKLKDDEIEEPEMYLGAQLGKMTVNELECWTMSAEKDVVTSEKNIEDKLAKRRLRLPTKCYTPLPSDYTKSEMETSAELKSDGVLAYQEMIGVLRWAVKLRRVNILLEVALMSIHPAMPREGHLQPLYRIFVYMKAHPKRKIAFDSQHPMINERMFKKCDWQNFYRDVMEAIPGDMPVPLGNPMSTHCFVVDASSSSDHANGQSQTDILIFCNKAPIIWFNKRQNTVDASTFGSKFQAMKKAVELTEALQYKL